MRVKDNQSLLDVAVQTSGSVESAFEIAVKNNISVAGSLKAGDKLENASVANNKVVDQFKVKELVSATAFNKDVRGQLSGIDYMIIEEDFIIG